MNGPEETHGEDVKEYYFYLDGISSHAYMKMLYKYPQVEFPYGQLPQENQRWERTEPEFELVDAIRDAFLKGRYIDVFIEYAKADQEYILCRITAINRGQDPAPIHTLPHPWYQNTWSWGYNPERPEITAQKAGIVRSKHRHLGDRWWYVDGDVPLLFTENDTNTQRLYGIKSTNPYVKDGVCKAVVHGHSDLINPERRGSKVAAHFQALVEPDQKFIVGVRFSNFPKQATFANFDDIFHCG